MPLPLVAIIIAAAVGLGVVALVLLKWSTIIDWFRGREQLVMSDKENIAITLQTKLKNGDYNTVQGIFNKNTSEFEDGVKYESKDVSEEQKKAHQKEELVIYT